MIDNDTSFLTNICKAPDISNISNLPIIKGQFSKFYVNYEDLLTVRNKILLLF